MTALLLALVMERDILHLKNGGRVEGKILEEKDDKVKVLQGRGITVELERKNIERIEYCLWFAPPAGRTVEFGEVVIEPGKFLRYYAPDGWRLGKAQGKAFASVYHYAPDGTALHRFDIFLQADKEGVKAAASKFRQAYLKAVPSAVVTTEPLKVGGADAVRVDVDFDKSDGKRDRAFWLFVGGPDERVAMVNFTEDASDFGVLGEHVLASAMTMRLVAETKMTDDERKAFDASVRQGAEAFAARDDAKAIAALTDAVKRADTFGAAWGLLARAQARKGDAAAAQASFEKALALDGADYVLETHYAAFLTDGGKAADAAKRLTAIVAAQPNYAHAVAELGRAMKKQDKNYDAGAAYEYLKQLLPRSADARYRRGQCYETEGRYEKARLEYMDALRKDPGYTLATEALEKIRNKPDK